MRLDTSNQIESCNVGIDLTDQSDCRRDLRPQITNCIVDSPIVEKVDSVVVLVVERSTPRNSLLCEHDPIEFLSNTPTILPDAPHFESCSPTTYPEVTIVPDIPTPKNDSPFWI